MSRRKAHRITVFKRKRGGVRVSPLSRLASHSRGAFLNPIDFSGLESNRRRSRRYRRNPALLSNPMGAIGGVVREVQDVLPDTLSAVGGFVGVKVIPKYIFPANWQVGMLRYASKGITTVALTLVANQVLGKRVGRMVLVGGLVAIGTELAGELLMKVGADISDVLSLGAYLPADYAGMDAYVYPNQ